MSAADRTRFEKEEAGLDATYKASLAAPVSDLDSAIASASQGGVIAVGSGGSLTAAQMLCTLHEHRYGHLSRAVTPLELACNPAITRNAAVFLFSAEGKNPDIIAAYKAAVMGGSRSVDIVTHHNDTRLNRLARRAGNGRIHVISSALVKDGYLAVNSLFSTIILLLRAYGHKLGGRRGTDSADNEVQNRSITPAERISADLESVYGDLESLLVLYDPLLKVPAVDLESKIREVGLCDVQIADFREFAHGRHLGLAGGNENRLIVAFPTSRTATIWANLHHNFPNSAATITCKPRSASWPDVVLDSICSVFRLVSWLGCRKGVDPGRPPVPEFGRRIYYSPPRLDRGESLPVHWGDVAGRRAYSSDSPQYLRVEYAKAIEKARFDALLFDYDGTVVDTAFRAHPPSPEIAAQLIRFLERGIPVWFVTGRGSSIHKDLRKALPESVWWNVTLGLYNGTVTQPLNTPMPKRNEAYTPKDDLNSASQALNRWESCAGGRVSVTTRPTQISVTPKEGQNVAELWHDVAGFLQANGFPIDRVVSTDHSIDVLPYASSKRIFLARMSKTLGIGEGRILTFADQGRWPGNDYMLLNRFGGVSVNHEPVGEAAGLKLCPARLRGPGAAFWYLSRLKLGAHGSLNFRGLLGNR